MNKRFNIGQLAAGLALSAPLAVLAAIPAEFTAAVTEATSSGEGMAGALLGIAAAVVVVMIGVKFVKRIKGAV